MRSLSSRLTSGRVRQSVTSGGCAGMPNSRRLEANEPSADAPALNLNLADGISNASRCGRQSPAKLLRRHR